MTTKPTPAALITARQLSRRTFLQGLALAGSTAWLAACGGQPAAPAPSGDQSQAAPAAGQAAAPQAATGPDAAKYGGVYRALFGGEVPNLDAAVAFNWEDWWMSNNLLYNRLYTYDTEGKFVPDLAADMPQVSEDGLVYTIPLRKDIKFHNGEPMTATDVKFTLDRIANPELKSPGAPYNSNIVGMEDVASGGATEVKGVEVIDDFTVKITLKSKQSVLPAILSVCTNGIVNKKATEEAGADFGTKVVVGTGPFKLKEWLVGEKIVLERHAEFFKPGLPYLDSVEIYLNVQGEQSVLRWENDEAEYVDGAPAAEITRILADPNLAPRLRSSPSTIIGYLTIADNVEPYTDVRVRQAIAMAIDKQAVADTLGVGVARVLDAIYTEHIPQYDANFKPKWTYAPEAAKQLLADAGHPDGFPTTLWWWSATGGQVIQEDLKKIGIDMTLETGDYSLYTDKINSGELPLRINGFAPDFLDAYPFVTDRFGCKTEPPPPDSAWCNDEVSKLIADANELGITDAKRIDAYRRMQEIVINEEVVYIPLYNTNLIALLSGKVKDDVAVAPVFLPVLDFAYFEKG